MVEDVIVRMKAGELDAWHEALALAAQGARAAAKANDWEAARAFSAWREDLALKIAAFEIARVSM